MGQEKEVSFPIETFMGVDRNADREDISPRHFHTLQNLWERKLGVLETRGGSSEIVVNKPNAIIGYRDVTRLYRSSTERSRMLAIRCSPSGSFATTPLTNVTGNFVFNFSQGNWNLTLPDGFNTIPQGFTIRLVGYGQSHIHTFNSITNAGLVGSQFEITISSAFLNPNITGMEVYMESNDKSSSSPVSNRLLWIAYIPIDAAGSYIGTHIIQGAPISFTNSAVAAETGTIARSYTAQAANITGGTLVPGKTYYVQFLAQHLKAATVDNQVRNCYTQVASSMASSIAITIPTGSNAIQITAVSPNTYAGLCMIGESPQLLQPTALYRGTSGTAQILHSHRGNPGVADILPVAADQYTFSFRASDYSMKDMFAELSDSGNITPIFVSRLNWNANKDVGFDPNLKVVEAPRSTAIVLAGQQLGDNETYEFEQLGNFNFCVNSRNPKLYEAEGYRHCSGVNYYINGFNVGAAVIEEHYGAPVSRLPFVKKIFKYQESILLTGGDDSVDIVTGNLAQSSRQVYFSRTSNPFNFTVPGAASVVYQYFTVESGGEPVSGLGIYSYTTGDQGPETQLVVGKRTSLWILGNLPIASSGNLPNVFVNNISKKAGCASHKSIVNTPIGLIITAIDNVYLVRENGEPVPIGDPISDIIKGGDLTRAVASFHDFHYKIAFYHPQYPGTSGYNNVEMWLDVNKVKQMQGVPDWKGPMVGRSVDSFIVEDQDGDGVSYNNARDRICIDRLGFRVFKTDVTPLDSDTQIFDFAVPVESIIETKDFEVSETDNNWNKLVKRMYWKARVRNESPTPMTATDMTYIDGVLVQTLTLSMSGVTGVGFLEQPMRLHPFFPLGRLRGRTIRKRFSTTSRIGVGGFVLNYEVEKRRI